MHKRIGYLLLALLACIALSLCCLGCSSSETSGSTGQSSSQADDSDHSDNIVIDIVGEDDPVNAFAATSTAAILGSTVSQDTGAEAKNECLSPASLYLALAMIGQGADGDALQQILDALSVADLTELDQIVESTMGGLKANYDPELGVYELNVANSIWANDGFSFTQDYSGALESIFDAECFTIPFGTEAGDSQLNSWVEDATNGLIKPDFQTTQDMVCAVLNTIYFKDGWTTPFNEADTSLQEFKGMDGSQDVEFMHLSELSCDFHAGQNFQSASLDFFAGGRVTIYLPDEGVSPRDLLSDASLVKSMMNEEPAYVDMNWSLPKFQIDSTFMDLPSSMERLGVTDVFKSSTESLSNMVQPINGSEPVPFSITDLIQQTHININEEGAEAAAMTAGIATMSALPEEGEIVDFVVDRPFAFSLTAPNGLVLFTGVIESL